MHKYTIIVDEEYISVINKINEFAKNNNIINTQYSTTCNNYVIVYSIFITYLPK